MTQGLDLEPKQLEAVVGLLRTYLPNTETWAYGSRVKWTSKTASDLDVVAFASADQESQLSALRSAIAESDLPFRLDLFVWDRIPEAFKDGIKRQHVVLTPNGPGQLPRGWMDVSVGDWAPFTYGKTLVGKDRNAHGSVPVYGSNGVVGLHDKAVTSGAAVIIGRKGTAGAVRFSPVPCWPIDTTFYVAGDDQDLVRYRYYALQSLGLDQMNFDSAVPGLNRSAAHSRRLVVPKRESEQRAIARVLGALDDKIAVNQRTNETLETMASALFDDWFVGFGPTRAKATGQAPYLPANVWGMFPSAFDYEGKPEGWRVCSLGDLVTPVRGKTITKKQCIDGEIPVIAGGRGPAYFHNESNVSAPVVTVSGSGANAGFVKLYHQDIWASDCSYICEAQSSHTYFWYVFLKSKQDQIFHMQQGAVQPHIYPSHLAGLQFTASPSLQLLDAFQATVKPWFEKARALSQESARLAELRDLLLPKLISGRVRVGGT